MILDLGPRNPYQLASLSEQHENLRALTRHAEECEQITDQVNELVDKVVDSLGPDRIVPILRRNGINKEAITNALDRSAYRLAHDNRPRAVFHSEEPEQKLNRARLIARLSNLLHHDRNGNRVIDTKKILEAGKTIEDFGPRGVRVSTDMLTLSFSPKGTAWLPEDYLLADRIALSIQGLINGQGNTYSLRLAETWIGHQDGHRKTKTRTLDRRTLRGFYTSSTEPLPLPLTLSIWDAELAILTKNWRDLILAYKHIAMQAIKWLRESDRNNVLQLLKFRYGDFDIRPGPNVVETYDLRRLVRLVARNNLWDSFDYKLNGSDVIHWATLSHCRIERGEGNEFLLTVRNPRNPLILQDRITIAILTPRARVEA